MNGLTKLYTEILNSVHCAVTADGVIYQLKPDAVISSAWQVSEDDVSLKIKIDDIRKIAVLPIHKVLKDGDWNKIIAFHPACESIFAGQSEVLNTLTTLAASRLHFTIQQIAANIIQLAIDKDQHGKLSLPQRELLRNLPAITEAAKKYFVSVAGRNTGVSGKYPLLTLRLDRAGAIDDIVYNRTCTLTTPLLDGPDPMCGISENSHSGKSQATIREVYSYIFPERRTYGSNSNDTPYLLALLECYYHVANHLNNIITVLGKYATDIQPIPLGWYSELPNINKLAKRYIPQTLPGNAGVSMIAEKPQNTPTAVVVKAPKTEDIFITKSEEVPVKRSSTIFTPDTNPTLGIVKTGILKSPPLAPIVSTPVPHHIVNQSLNTPMLPGPNVELTMESRLNQSLYQRSARATSNYPMQTQSYNGQWPQQSIRQGPITRGDYAWK